MHLYNLSYTRTSQFIVGLNKYLEAINNKFSVGMRFKMRFEGEDSPERRYVCAVTGHFFVFFFLSIYSHD